MADEPTEHPEDQADPAEPVADTPPASDETPVEAVEEASEQPSEGEIAEQRAEEQPAVSDRSAEEQPAAIGEPVAEQPAAPEEPAAGEPVAEGLSAEELSAEGLPAEEVSAEEVSAKQPPGEPVAEEDTGEELASDDGVESEEEPPTPRVKPSVPGAHLEVDIVPEGVDPLAPEQPSDPYAIEEDEEPRAEEDAEGAQLPQPISSAAIDLAAGARYKATGKRKTAIARVILRPGSGAYLVNGRALDEHFPRITLQRNIRQPLETVGYEERMDVVARLHGGGISAQAGALRHGISRALLEADPNLRGELKRRGFLTRDSRAKERKKAGLKKARKRPQFSKR
jgi:small subunit ribosomal protein S9